MLFSMHFINLNEYSFFKKETYYTTNCKMEDKF